MLGRSLKKAMSETSSKQLIWLIFSTALIMRLIYAVFVAPRVLGAGIYIHADTPSFVAPGVYLRELGVYTSDPGFRDALFTRVPGYALVLWMIGFLTSNIYPVVAAVQVVVDSITAVMLAMVAMRAAGKQAGLLTGLLYATYPFALWWVTLTIPDVMTTALAVGGILLFTRDRNHPLRDAAFDGAFVALATLSREYLILLICPMAVAWLLYIPSWHNRIKTVVVSGLVTLLVYLPWPLRNYVNHGETIVFRSASSGYRQYAPDMGAALNWMATWTPRQGDYLDKLSQNEPLDLPAHVLTKDEENWANRLFERARECGTGIRLWGGQTEPDVECNDEVIAGFTKLKKSYVARHPVRWLFEVPLLNLHKTLFKAELIRPTVKPIITTISGVLFGYRSLIVLVGLFALFTYRKRREMLVIAAFSLTVYVFMAGYIRGLQMRYLLQADVILLVPFSILVVSVIRSQFDRDKTDEGSR
jgi:hypothetical protein